MNAFFKKTSTVLTLLTAVLFFAHPVLAQEPGEPRPDLGLVDATVLATNFDSVDQRLYVDINYDVKPCGIYQIRFHLITRNGDKGYISVDITDGHGTNSNVGDVLGADVSITEAYMLNKRLVYKEDNLYKRTILLSNTSVGGYSLQFKLNEGGDAMNNNISPSISPADSPRIVLEVFRKAEVCLNCGAAGGEMVFGGRSKDIREGCPYTHTGEAFTAFSDLHSDIIACYRNTSPSGPQNWVAVIQDPRDCNMYRTVKMPDGRWWFASNLLFTTNESEVNIATKAGSNVPSNLSSLADTFAFCPNTPNDYAAGTGGTSYNYLDNQQCRIHGLLYSWNLAMRDNGRGSVNDSTPIGAVSTARGICPPNWHIPGDYEWGNMLNLVETTDLYRDHDRLEATSLTDTNFYGEKASVRLKTGALGSMSDIGNWEYEYISGQWFRTSNSGNNGLDYYGMSIAPAGSLEDNGSGQYTFYNRSKYAYMLSSTAVGDGAYVYGRVFGYDTPLVRRTAKLLRAYAKYSVRCVK